MTEKILQKPQANFYPMASDRDGSFDGRSRTNEGRTFVPALIFASCEVAEKVVTGTVGGVQEIRGEVARRVVSTLGWIEESSSGINRLVRELVQRVDGISLDVVELAEVIALRTIRTAASSTFWSPDAPTSRPSLNDPQARA